MASVISVLAKISADTSAYTAGMRQAQSATDSLEKASAKSGAQIASGMADSGKRAGSGFAGALKGFVGPALFAGGILGAVNFGKSLIVAAEAESKANRLIENITTSMGQFDGQVTEVTDRLTKMAEAQALATGVDEDAIKASQAKLLTFSQIGASANEVGGLFDRATQAAMDLNAAGFGDMEGNAIRLGKALQDPIKGMNAMSRSGITFDESQKAMITNLVKTGETAKAQGIIMQAVEQQVGGSAASQVTQTARMAQAWGNLKETIGLAVLPAFDGMLKFVNDKVFPVLTAGANALPAVFSAIGKAVGPTLQIIGDMFKQIWAGVGPAIQELLPQVMAIVSAFSPFSLILKAIQPLMPQIVSLLTQVANVMSGVLGAALPIVTSLVNNLIAAILPLIKMVLPILSDLFAEVGPLLIGIFNDLAPMIAMTADTVGLLLQAIMPLLPPILGLAKQILPPVLSLFKALMPPILTLVNIFARLLVPIIAVLSTALGGIIGVIGKVIGKVVNGIAQLLNWLMPIIQPLLNAVIDGINGVLKFLGFKTIPKISSSAISTAKANGAALGTAKAEGENKAYLKNRTPDAITGGGTGGAGGNSKADAAAKTAQAIKDTAASFKTLLKGLAPMKTVEVEMGKFEKAAVDSMDNVTEGITKARKDGLIKDSDASKLTKYAKAAGAALQEIAQKRDELTKALEKAQKTKDDSVEFVKGLQDLYKGIQPLDRVEKEVGKFEASVVSGFDAINAKIADGQKIGLFGKGVADELKKYADKTSKALTDIAKKRDELAKSYAEMTDKLAAAKDFKKSVQDTLSGLTDITKMGTSATDMINNFKNLIAKTTEFQKQLKALKDAGLNKAAFNNILQAGADVGGATAEALISGGPDAIREVNSLYDQFALVAEDTATLATDKMYDGGISAIQGFIDGIVAQDAELQKASADLATEFNKVFQTTVDTALINLDKMIADIKAQQTNLETTATQLADAFSKKFQTELSNAMAGIKVSVPATIQLPAGATTSGGASISNTTVELTVNAGLGTNPVELGKAVVDAIAKYEKSSGTVFVRA